MNTCPDAKVNPYGHLSWHILKCPLGYTLVGTSPELTLRYDDVGSGSPHMTIRPDCTHAVLAVQWP